MSCQDGWHAIDQLDRFIGTTSMDLKIKNSDVFVFPNSTARSIRTKGEFTTFIDPMNIFNKFRYIGNRTYTVDKYSGKSTANGQSIFLDGIITRDLFIILMDTEGFRVAQIHLYNERFEIIDTLNQNGVDQRTQIEAIDMVYD